MPYGRVCIKRAAVNTPAPGRKERAQKKKKKHKAHVEAVKLEMGRRYCYRYCFRSGAASGEARGRGRRTTRPKVGRTKMRVL